MSRKERERVSAEQVQDTQELERRRIRRLIGFLLLPVLPFPLLSLLTYSWKDISWLNAPPPDEPANLIGQVGAWSVFFGYTLMGLALWLLPVVVLLFSLLLVYGKIAHMWRRLFWTALFLVALCCLLQLGSGAAIISDALERLNLKPNAGGLIGYGVMTCLLARWFSPVGGGLLMLSICLFSLVMAIGVRTLFTGLGRLTGWWESRRARDDGRQEGAADPGASEVAPEQPAAAARQVREAARQVRDAARRVRQQERQKEGSPAMSEAGASETPAADALQADLVVRRAAEARQAAQQAREAERVRVSEAAARPAQAAAPARKRPEPVPPAAVPDEPQAESDYVLPSVTLLNPIPKGAADPGNIGETADVLVETLRQFNVPVEVVGTTPGPVLTLYELRPAPNIKVERIANLTANLQMALEANSLRVQAPIPGKNAVGIEIPNRRARAVTFREIVEGETWRSCDYEIPLALGKDVAGNDLIVDLTKAPHLLVAGATGSGKSVCLNAILSGLLMSRTPEQLRLILVDPKRVEFTCYNDLPHLLVPVINDPKKVAFGLRWAITEMDKRYRMLQKANCRNIVAFNSRVVATQEELFGGPELPVAPQPASEELPARLPYIVIVVDEVADIMAAVGKEVEPAIHRLTSLSRAVGIHLILATQRPSVDVITGTIKSNIPGRIAFKVSQANDSRTILDNPGAEELIGKGDMLFLRDGSQLMRAQGAWVGDDEIARVVAFVKEHCRPCYDQALIGKLDRIKESDPEEELATGEADEAAAAGDGTDEVADADEGLLANAMEVIRMTRRASTTMLQRRLRIGYTRAARLMDLLEERGIVGPQMGAGARDILVDLDAGAQPGGAASYGGYAEEAERDAETGEERQGES